MTLPNTPALLPTTNPGSAGSNSRKARLSTSLVPEPSSRTTSGVRARSRNSRGRRRRVHGWSARTITTNWSRPIGTDVSPCLTVGDSIRPSRSSPFSSMSMICDEFCTVIFTAVSPRTRWNPASQAGAQHSATVCEARIDSSWAWSCRNAATAEANSAPVFSSGSAHRTMSAPVGVSREPVVVRTISAWPNCRSNRAIVREALGCATPQAAAARLKLPCSAVSASSSRAARSGQDISK